MTKVELIAAVAEKLNLTKKDAEAAVNSALDVITESLKGGDKVTLVGFGTFRGPRAPRAQGPQPPDRCRDHHRGFQAARIQGWQGPEGRCSVSYPVLHPVASARGAV